MVALGGSSITMFSMACTEPRINGGAPGAPTYWPSCNRSARGTPRLNGGAATIFRSHDFKLLAPPPRISGGAATHKWWRFRIVLRINGGAFTHKWWRPIYRTEHFRTFLQNTLQNFRKREDVNVFYKSAHNTLLVNRKPLKPFSIRI